MASHRRKTVEVSFAGPYMTIIILVIIFVGSYVALQLAG